jgi:hypothetical protein
VLTDYGAFRDLQRHRLLTIEWQPLTLVTDSPNRKQSSRQARTTTGIGSWTARRTF